jgi:hypothetical protein
MLGMVVDADGALAGQWNGRVAVKAVHRAVSERSRVDETFHHTGPNNGPSWHYDTNSAFFTRFEAKLDPSMLLAFTVRQVPPSIKNRTGFDPSRGPELEKHLGFYAIDREYGARLLSGAVLGEILRDANLLPTERPAAPSVGTTNLIIKDDVVSAMSVVEDFLIDVEALRVGLERVGRVAEILLAARAGEPAPWEPAARAAWGTVASRLGLGFDGIRMRMGGGARGLVVDVRPTIEPNPDPQRMPTHLSTRIHVTFARPLGCGLALTKQAPAAETGLFRGLVNKVFGGQDIIVGDAPFDAAFVVRGTSDSVRARLTPPVRERLLAALFHAPSLEVTDEGLLVCIPEIVTDGALLERIVGSMIAAAEAFNTPG